MSELKRALSVSLRRAARLRELRDGPDGSSAVFSAGQMILVPSPSLSEAELARLSELADTLEEALRAGRFLLVWVPAKENP